MKNLAIICIIIAVVAAVWSCVDPDKSHQLTAAAVAALGVAGGAFAGIRAIIPKK